VQRMADRWLIYGATGYTGQLVARLAVARGERPILAGRRGPAVAALAADLGLDHRVVDLADPAALRAALADVAVVAHCAGPFVDTSAPMVDACLATGTHYVDITGELDVFEALYARHDEAVAAGIVLLPGAGFDVVPTDCLAALLAASLPGAVSLELAFRAGGGMSPGTARTGLYVTAAGGRRRTGGVLRSTPFGVPSRIVAFPSGPRRVGAVPWGDLVSAYRSTGIGDITVYTSLPVRGRLGRLQAAATARLLRYAVPRALAARLIRRRVTGPSPQTRAATSIEVWGEVRTAGGETRSATLTGPNAYDLTADALLRAVARLRTGTVPPGAHTPSTALGADFVRELDGVSLSLPA